MNSFKKNADYQKNQKNQKTKIYFENEDILKNGSKLLSSLLNKLTHTSYLESLLYSSEGIYEIDEKNNKLYTLEYIDNETEKITIFNSDDNTSFDVFCDYGVLNKVETFKFPVRFFKIKKYCYVFSNSQNSSLKLVVEKNLINDEIIDFYYILNKNLKLKDNVNFYEELKEFNKIIFNV